MHIHQGTRPIEKEALSGTRISYSSDRRTMEKSSGYAADSWKAAFNGRARAFDVAIALLIPRARR